MDSFVPRLTQVVIDSTRPRESAEFWRQLLGLVYRTGHEPPSVGDDPVGRDWLNLLTPDGDPCLAFQAVKESLPSTWPDPKVPQQLHLDITVKSLDELNSVHTRVLALGGSLLVDRSDSEDEPLHVYADLDGHPFCIFVVT